MTLYGLIAKLFQSTLRRTERLIFCNFVLSLNDFNPRSGERSDSNLLQNMQHLLLFQSTLRRTERLKYDTDKMELISISIHAPANGATDTPHRVAKMYEISIHAPANGATMTLVCMIVFVLDFNPRSGERSDQHPTLTYSQQTNFNPRSGERSDLNMG